MAAFAMLRFALLLALLLISICHALPVRDVASLAFGDLDLDEKFNTTLTEHYSEPWYNAPYTSEDTLQEFFDTILTKRSTTDNVSNTTTTDANNESHIHALQRRKCTINLSTGKWDCDDNIPTMSEMVAQMRDKPGGTANRGRLAAFYVNLADDPALQKGGNDNEAKLVGWCNKNNLGGKFYWWANCVDKYWLEAQAKHLKENGEKIAKAHPEWGSNPEQTFLKGIFQAMAFAATNPTVLFFTKKGVDWDKNTIWQEVEYPTLVRNKNVKQILRIDPNCPDNKPELLWSRARRDPLPPVVFKYPDMR